MDTVGAIALVAGVFLADHAAIYVAPRLLSRIAFLRVGPDRSVPIPLDAAEALAEPAGAASSYRTAPAVRYDASALPGPEIVDTGDAHMIFIRERAEVLARPRLRGEGATRKVSGRGRGVKPLLRVRLRVERDRLVLRSTYHPALTVGALAAGLTAWLGFGLTANILLVPLFLAVTHALASRREANDLLGAVESEVASRIGGLRVRVAPVPGIPEIEPEHAASSDAATDLAAGSAQPRSSTESS